MGKEKDTDITAVIKVAIVASLFQKKLINSTEKAAMNKKILSSK